ncbi:MAG TPA: alkaline phosphatase family protein [Pirellulales bacterium]|jgi:YVTN family beta-propeller protein|nr:alkaline phosphatase family protein [Pirellulales bacterium]
MRNKRWISIVVLIGFVGPGSRAWSEDKTPKAQASVTEKPADEATLLPNGWKLTPAGRQVIVTDLPLNIVVSPDGRYAFVATNGYNSHDLTAVEVETGKKLAAESRQQSWFGLAADFKQGTLWWSGGGSGKLHAFQWSEGKLQPIEVADKPAEQPNPATAPAKPAAPATAPAAATPAATAPAAPATPSIPATRPAPPPPPPPFQTGLFFDASDRSLYRLAILSRATAKTFVAGDTKTEIKGAGFITRTAADGSGEDLSAPCGKRPYDVLRARNGLLYVSDWADRCVLVVDAETLRVIGRIPVGEHPNQLALHPKDDRLFVACASSNGVWVIDTSRGTVEETIFTALFPKSPEGSTPDALCVSPDGEMLYVANADNNCVAVIDIESPRRSEVKGFIPTGWYPTSVTMTPDGKRLLVGVGKGNQTRSNRPAQATLDDLLAKPASVGGYRPLPLAHVGTTLSGALSIVPVPDEKELARYTSQVYRNCPYSDELLSAAPAPNARKTAIPVKVGDPSPIKYVIYIIKENRTYDQVFGDIPRGNGDPSLVMFGEEVTPNHHKLANQYVLLDNLYCNGHVSRDGHPWSTMAYNTDYVARDWALTYSGRRGVDDDDAGDLSNAPSGYIWDACKRKGISYRNYGEYGGRVSQPDGSFRVEGRVPGLVGHMSPNFGLPLKDGKQPRDTDNVAVFLSEFHEFEKNGNLPRLIIMSLGEDHTQGTVPGVPTPQSCVASNDLAIGQLVDALSRSKFWPQMAIFMIEDDAQNGVDHVDAHRTVGLVISPFVRRGHLDSTQYSTAAMLRTIELILGLPPLSQFDAAATPMSESFSDTADLTPYEHEKARIDLNARNTLLAYGAERSSKMDFSEYDRIDDFELNEILWRSIKGTDAPIPPAVRRAIAYRSFNLPDKDD